MPELNRNGLADIMDIEPTEAGVEQVLRPNNNEAAGGDPIAIIRSNIARAESILTLIENEMINGNFSARLAEVASLIINSVTQAATQIVISKANQDSLQIKKDVLQLKEKELEIKQKYLSYKAQQQVEPGRDRLIITDRESIMRILKKESEPVRQIVSENFDGGSNDD